MLKNYLKIALRNLIKRKLYTFITIFSLSLGMICCLLIMLYINQELSYDNFHSNSNRIYRVVLERTRPQGKSYSASSPVPLAPALKEEYPEIEYIARIYLIDQVLFEYKGMRVFEDDVAYADPDLFTVFSFPLLKGNPSHLIDTPDSMVITESMALKYFGDEEPLNQTIRINNQYDFKVTGVVEDIPVNSHFRFDCVISFLALNEENFGTWLNLWTGVTSLYTYALLPADINLEEFTRRVEDIISRHSGERPGITRKIFFQPLRRIHLYSHLESEIEANNFVSNLIILATIAVLILIIACINFMNLSVAQSSKRAREVGMRKVLGADRFQLVKQFMGESILFTLLALFFSLFAAEVFLPIFSSLVGKPVNFIIKDNLLFLTGFVTVSLIVGVISSVFPSLFLSRYQPARTLKGLSDSVKSSSGQLAFRKALVVIQFSVSILLIVCTIIIVQQLHFMRGAYLGFDKDYTVVIPVFSESGRKQYETIKHELAGKPGIIGASACLKTPIGAYTIITRAFPQGKEAKESFFVDVNFVDYDFIDHFGIQLVAGRKFSREYSTDSSGAFIVNETTVRECGFFSPEDAIGIRLHTGLGVTRTIIGVIKDYHISSFHDEISPLVMGIDADYFYTMAVKINSKNVPSTLASIEKIYNTFIPEYPFTYTFLDEDIDRLYKGEEQTSRIIRTFSIIAIFIACLGLLGLAAFTAEKRTKEIGIRKVLGASMPNILFMLSSEFTIWVLVSNIIAWPVAYFAMNKWLGGFAYRIDMKVWPFVLGAFLAFMISVFTVSFQAVKSALADPVKSLRYE